MAQFSFNAREVEPDQGRIGAIPAGWYKTMVTKTELKPNNDGTGRLIAATIQVMEGTYKGSSVFTNFNVENPSEKAQDIGRKQLSALCHAVGVLDMHDTDQLKNIPFFTRLKVTPAVMDDNDPNKVKYEEKNEPNAYRDVNDQAAVAAATKTSAAAQAGQKAPAAAPAQPPQQQFTPPPQQQAFQPPQQQPQQQFAPPPQQQQQQFQAPPAQQQFQPQQQQVQPQQQASGVMPGWAAAPEQPWGAAAPAQQQSQQQAPQATPEQQQQYQQTQQASPPWGAPA